MRVLAELWLRKEAGDEATVVIYILLREENVDLDLILRLSRPESILFDAQFIIPGYIYQSYFLYTFIFKTCRDSVCL